MRETDAAGMDNQGPELDRLRAEQAEAADYEDRLSADYEDRLSADYEDRLSADYEDRLSEEFDTALNHLDGRTKD